MKYILSIIMSVFAVSAVAEGMDSKVQLQQFHCSEVTAIESYRQIDYNAATGELFLKEMWMDEVHSSSRFSITKVEVDNNNILTLEASLITMIEGWKKLVVKLDLNTGMTTEAYLQPMWINSPDGEPIPMASLICDVEIQRIN